VGFGIVIVVGEEAKRLKGCVDGVGVARRYAWLSSKFVQLL
jgi:hypothetical protein